MKKFQSLGRSLSKNEMKAIRGGGDVLSFDDGSMCNVYCGKGAPGEGKCAGSCPYCDNAGNGSGSGTGQNKMCASSIG